jgi:tetratricopeptide (TPR) repeat protein
MKHNQKTLLKSKTLKLETAYRKFLYKISHFIGSSRPYQYFFTYGGRLFLLLLVSIIVVLAFAHILEPGNDVSTNITAKLGGVGGLSSGSVLSENLTVSAGGTSLSGTLTSRPSWSDVLGNVTNLATKSATSFGSLVTSDLITAILILFALGLLVITITKSRRQVVVGKFENYIGTDSEPIAKFTEGVSSLLNGELHLLRSLYSEVDDRRAITSVGGRKGPLEYAIIVGDPGDKVKDIISSETKMKIGPIEFPVGAVSGMFSKIFSGPQIIGSFHQDGNLIILNAFMSGPQSKSWRVEGRIGPKIPPHIEKGVVELPISTGDRPIHLNWNDKDKKIENLDDMVKELAYRIFTDLTSGGSTKWRATYAFTEGLKDYRNCLLSKKDQIRNLKNAERRFFEAISEDKTFDLAYYNLGVVYTELENLDASDKAFLKTIEISPDRWQAYYALALNRFNKISKDRKDIGLAEYDDIDETLLWDIIHPCNQAIALKPKNPHLHILIGVCYRMLAIKKRNSTEGREDSQKLFREAVKSHTYVARRAWNDLCASQLSPADSIITRKSDIRKASSTALWDLARTYYSYVVCGKNIEFEGVEDVKKIQSYLTAIESVLDQALLIDNTNATIFHTLGIVYYTQGKYAPSKFKDATRSFESATQIDPNTLKYWLLLALSSERAGDKNKRDFAVGKILEFPSWIEGLPESWKKRYNVPDILPGEGRSKYLRTIHDFQKDYFQDQDLVAIPGILAELPIQKDELKNYIVKLVNDLPPSFDIPWLDEGSADPSTLHLAAKGCSLSYHLAYHVEDNNLRIQLYQIALEFLDEIQPETEWSRWAKGTISYDLALKGRRFSSLLTTYDCFKNNYSLEMKNKGIQTDLVRFLLDMGINYNALIIASEALQKNPLGFEELYNFGTCLSGIDLKQSLSAFESALLVKPYDVDTLLNMGTCYWKWGLNCKERIDKENFWNQSIQYYDRAREALKTKELQRGKSDSTRFMISYRLGNCYFELSEYGKAASNYELALQLLQSNKINAELKTGYNAVEYQGDLYCCTLKCAKAYLHIRNHNLCEKYLNGIINEIEKTPYRLPGEETDPQLSEEVLLQELKSSFGTIYTGEIYIKALLGKAYSYTERDVGFDVALALIRKAFLVKQFIKEKIKDEMLQFKKQEDTSQNDKEELMKKVLTERMPLYEAEILDRCGWLYYKKAEDLEGAKDKILKALFLKADADYNFHLATIYETLFRETGKKPIYARWALAYCYHARDMAPRPGLEDRVKQLIDQINGEYPPIQPNSQG